MSNVSIRYIVSDVDAAVAFYTKLFEFEVEMRPAPGFAALKRDNLQLLLNVPGAGGAGAPCQMELSPNPEDGIASVLSFKI